MTRGQEAVDLFEKGLNLSKPDQKAEKCMAYCAIAEIYMTDLCDEDEAQARVEKVLELAHGIGEGIIYCYNLLTQLCTARETSKIN
jgi:hypothetical protein